MENGSSLGMVDKIFVSNNSDSWKFVKKILSQNFEQNNKPAVDPRAKAKCFGQPAGERRHLHDLPVTLVATSGILFYFIR